MPNPIKTLLEITRVGKPQAIFAVTGLKKKFTQESFVNLLEKSRLRVSTVGIDHQLNGYIAVCKKSQI
jgi:hypothetical protein